MLEPTASDCSWRCCSHTWQVRGKSPCHKNFVSCNGNFSGAGHLIRTLTKTTSWFHKSYLERGKNMSPYPSISAQWHWDGIEHLELWLPFLSWAEVSGFHLFLMLPDLRSLWCGFSSTSSHLLKCAENGNWSADRAYWNRACTLNLKHK